MLLDNNDVSLITIASFIAAFDFSEEKGAQNGMIRFLVTQNKNFDCHFVETRECLNPLIYQTNN